MRWNGAKNNIPHTTMFNDTYVHLCMYIFQSQTKKMINFCLYYYTECQKQPWNLLLKRCNKLRQKKPWKILTKILKKIWQNSYLWATTSQNNFPYSFKYETESWPNKKNIDQRYIIRIKVILIFNIYNQGS